ncbi:MAG: hypothetical protein H6672_19215 [Anaerolineaceae bacterium]|nr:hypothetical protein [Anaerolineaceae bacterium]
MDRAPVWAALLLTLLLLPVILAPSGAAQATPLLQEIPPSYQMVAENDLFQLYVDSDTLAFKLLDKRSNYLWHSGIDELLEGDRLNKSWRAFAQSGISIEYLDKKAVNSRTSIANANHTLEVTPIEQGISAVVTFEDYGITVGVTLQLEATGLRVAVPFATINEGNPDFRLGQVYIYPFLGATRGSSVPGYMLIPDGIGSLIRFADTTKAKNMLYARYYGDDLGILAYQPYDPLVTPGYPASFPVFGVAHGEGQNAFLSVVEQGSAYGEIQAHPAGILTNFNFIYNAFIYNEPYFQATNRSGAGVTTVQRETNHFDVVLHFRFLTGDAADYVGMARSYQQYLLDSGRLHKADDPNLNIGIRLEFLGGDKERVMFWDRFIPMTTVSQMSGILDSLQIPNPEVIYYGWQPLGASTMPPTSVTLEGGLGSLDELRTLAEKITAEGGHFSLYLEPQAALWEEPGYSPRNDVAMAITNVNLEGFGRHYNYYFTLAALQEHYATLTEDIASQLNVGLALDGIGSVLYSDFRRSSPLNREDAIEAYQSLLAESPVRLGLYRPNDYLLGFTQAYYDMPLGDDGYIYTSESVPFLPIVLAGYIPYYSTPVNFSSNLENDLLRQVEYGIYPSYFVTHEPTANMLNTRSAWIYSSSYAQWGEQIQTTYQWMNALLAPVRGQAIIAHEKLADGVFATTYANNKQIIVNYTDQPYVRGGVTVEAKNALLLENGL